MIRIVRCLKIELFICTLLMLLTASAAAQTSEPKERQLRTLIDEMASAQTEYDAGRLDRIFSADYIEISPLGELDERSKVLGFYTPQAKEAAKGVSVAITKTFRSVRDFGNTVVWIVELAYDMKKDAIKFPPRKLIATVVARRVEGVWKLASVQYTGIRPPTPPSENKK